MGLTKAGEPSHRCVGLSEKLFGQAGVVKQAAPLKVDQILVIHDAMLSDNTSRWDRAFCTYSLVALYGRARHSDFKKVDYIEWDVPPAQDGAVQGRKGCIISNTRRHKTSRTTAKKARLLPIIVAVAGVHAQPWIHVAKRAFEAVGLSL